jgi:tetratricopeptide (TPR) repeat protein
MMGRNNEALTLVNKSLVLDPNNINALHTKGVILLNSGDHVQAEKWFDKLLELNFEDVDGWYEKTRCLVREGKIENAINYIEKVVDIGGKEYADKAKTEKDFEGLRDNIRFNNLVNINIK